MTFALIRLPLGGGEIQPSAPWIFCQNILIALLLDYSIM